MQLYDDQKDWCRKTIAAFERQPDAATPAFTKVMGVAATGAGKTIMAAAITDYVLKRWKAPSGQNSRVLFLADRDELVGQAGKKILDFTGMPTDREQGAERASLQSRVVVGSMQTLQNPTRLERWPKDHFSIVIVDEAHGSMADTWQTVMNHFHEGGARILGITATPERGDDRDLWEWWQHKSAEIGLFELIELGRLAPIRVKTLPIDLDCRGVKTTREGLNEEQLSHAIEPAFEAIIEGWERQGENRKTIWFLPGVQASKRFAEILIERGHTAQHIDGSSKGRKQILEAYDRDGFKHLCNSDLLIKGYDQPDIACVVNLSPGKSRVTYQQKVGRGTRVAPDRGKTDLLILDFLWQFSKLGIVRPADLVARTEREAKRIQEQLDKQARESDRGLAESFTAMDIHEARELSDNQLVKTLINQLVQNTRRKTSVYDASAAAALMNAPELLVYEPSTEWEKQKPTDKQKEILKKKGISVQTVKTKGHASMLIDTLIKRQEANLSTFKQAARLTANGIEGAAQMTFSEASAEMDRLIQNSPTH